MSIVRFQLLFLLVAEAMGGQIHSEMRGVWVPEQVVAARTNNELQNIDRWMFPLEGIVIVKEIVDEMLANEGSIDTGNVILVKAYKSELKAVFTKEIGNGTNTKYQVIDLYKTINLKYTPLDKALSLKDASVFLSVEGKRLLLEINGKKTYFLNRIDDPKFKDSEDAGRLLEQNIMYGFVETVKNFSGRGSAKNEIALTGTETDFRMFYGFHKGFGSMVVLNQEGQELFNSGSDTANQTHEVSLRLQNVTKLIVKVNSQQADGEWGFTVLIK